MADGTRKRRPAPEKAIKTSGKKPGRTQGQDERTLARAAGLIAKNPLLSKREALRTAGITDAPALRRLADKLSLPVRKPDSEPPRKPVKKAAQKLVKSGAQAAAPLLARAPKKVAAVGSHASEVNPAPRAAPYQPKTDIPPLHQPPAQRQATMPMPNAFALAQQWMALGMRMTANGIAMHASMARAALATPPAAIAMKHGAQALDVWLALFRVGRPGKD